jgi:hypothetical protein
VWITCLGLVNPDPPQEGSRIASRGHPTVPVRDRDPSIGGCLGLSPQRAEKTRAAARPPFKSPSQNEDLSRRAALGCAMRRPRSRPYLSRYERSLRPCLASPIAPRRRGLILKRALNPVRAS